MTEPTTALDLSPYIEASDSPDVAALKQRVRDVAKKYAAKHNWCDVVDRALREAGVDTKPVIAKVNVTTAVGFRFVVKVAPQDLAGKTLEEQKTVLAAKIGEVSLSGSGGVTGALTVAPESITVLELIPLPATAEAPSDEEHPAWRYVSNDGRVKHLLVTGTDLDPNGRYTACGDNIQRGYVTDNSARGTGQHCARCARMSSQFRDPRVLND